MGAGRFNGIAIKTQIIHGFCNRKKVQLAWSVSDNQDASGYDIERADDGVHFSTIIHVNGTNRTGDADYTTTDAQPKLNTALLYRLKLLSKNGTYQYSGLRMVRIDDKLVQIALKENPVTDVVQFSVQNIDENFSAEIISYEGKQCLKKQFASSGAQTNLQLPVKNLSSGIYFLVIKTNTLTKSFQFVKN